jgi:hypothetical protein
LPRNKKPRSDHSGGTFDLIIRKSRPMISQVFPFTAALMFTVLPLAWVMVSMKESSPARAKREVGRAVLQALVRRLTADSVPNWHFMLSDDEVSVLRIRNGAGARERVGSWIVDQEMKLVFGPHMTEWITAESWSRVVDEAVQITAKVIVDAEFQEASAPQLRIAHP